MPDDSFREVTRLKSILFSVLIAFVGGILLFISTELGAHPAGQALISQLGGVLVATAILSVGWDFVGKRRFAREVKRESDRATSLENSGIARVANNYTDPQLWMGLNRAKEVVITASYADAWLREHRPELRRVLESGGTIRIYMADPSDERLLQEMSHHQGKCADRLRDKLENAQNRWLSLSDGLDENKQKNLQVCCLGSRPTYAVYQIDSRTIWTPGVSSSGLVTVPAIELEDGPVLRFIKQDIEALHSVASKPLSRS